MSHVGQNVFLVILFLLCFFLSPQSDKSRSDAFYLTPERVAAPDSPIWYSTQPVMHQQLEILLSRILAVREIQEILTSKG